MEKTGEPNTKVYQVGICMKYISTGLCMIIVIWNRYDGTEKCRQTSHLSIYVCTYYSTHICTPMQEIGVYLLDYDTL